MSHIKEEQISAYLDKQLNSEERLVVEAHFRECESCRAVRDDLFEISRLFSEAERFEPSPFLWNRIAADFDKEAPSTHHWITSLIDGLRKNSWNLRLASVALIVVVIAGIAVFRENSDHVAEQAALADIDRAYQGLAALDPDTYNPFGSGLPRELDANPFRNVRLSSERTGILPKSRGID
jgi:predicted anti-sigma-YlaC factor YlaD